jgi:Xaa-Pro aminopeptidase
LIQPTVGEHSATVLVSVDAVGRSRWFAGEANLEGDRVVCPGRHHEVGVARPEYAATGQPSARESRAIRTDDEILAMRTAGRVAAEALIEVGRHVRPGVTTDELDRIGHEFMVDAGFPAKNLAGSGYGEFDPVAPNDTEKNRELNRRIEIILVPNLEELPSLTGNQP